MCQAVPGYGAMENKQDMAQLSRYSVHLGGDREKHK